MVLEKQVKEYSDRQRINLNKADGFNANDTVYILSADEYGNIKQSLLDLKKQIDIVNDSKDTAIKTAKEINKNNLSDVHKIHQKEIDKKDNEIKELHEQLNQLRGMISNFLIQLNGLNAIDVIIRKKYKNLISELQSKIWIKSADKKTIVENKGNSNKSKITE